MGSCKSQVSYLFQSCFILLKNNRPKNKEELFHLPHFSFRNVIERIFGVLKRRFRILRLAPEYNMQIQAQIPAALCAIHNFISHHDPDKDEMEDFDDFDDGGDGDDGENDEHRAYNEEAIEPSVRRDRIAQEMWDDYQRLLEARQEERQEGTESDDDEFDNNMYPQSL